MGTLRTLGEALFLLVTLLLVLVLLGGIGTADDIYEENDDLAHTYMLEPGVYSGLNASDPDCFAVNITVTGILRVTIWYDGSSGDAELHLFDTNGTTVDSSLKGTGEERVEINVTNGERFFFEIRNGSGIEYHLAIVNGNELSWTFSVYMDGDNSLHDNMEPDLVEMREAGSTRGMRVVVLKDGEGSKDTKVVYVMPGYDVILPPYVVNQSWGKEVNMGDPAILSNWLEWSLRTFDTGGKIALDLWNHGNGVWGCCWDSNSGNDLLTLEDIRTGIETALAGAGGDDGRGIGEEEGTRGEMDRIELLGSDSCLMQVIELAYEVDGLASYFIASQEDEPKDGWDYAPFLTELSGNLSWSGEQLGLSIIRGYIAEYGVDGDETLSVISVDNVGGLTASLSALALEFRSDLDKWADEIRIARGDTRDYNYYYVDILNLVENLQRRTDNATILGLLEDLEIATRNVILHEEHGGKRYDSNGLSLYFPKSGYDHDYDDITFGNVSGWGEFLKEWIPVDGGPMDHFERKLFYEMDNDSYEGNDTMLVKLKPYSDKNGEAITILVELVNETSHTVNQTMREVTINKKESGFIDFYIQLPGDASRGEYSIHASLYDSQGNRDDILISKSFMLDPYNTAPPPPPPPSIALFPDEEEPLVVHQGQNYRIAVEIYAGTPKNFSWDLDGDTIIDTVTTDPFVDHTFPEPGDFILSVIAMDDWNRTGNASFSIHVNAPPVFHGFGFPPPTTNVSQVIGNPGTIDTRVTVEDHDGEIVWFEWDLDDDGLFEGFSDSALQTNVELESSGDYVVNYRITDDHGASREYVVEIHVNHPPEITDLSPVLHQNGALLEYNLTVSVDDPDGSRVRMFYWDLNSDGTDEMETVENTTIAVLEPGWINITVGTRDDNFLYVERTFRIFVTQPPSITLYTVNGSLIPRGWGHDHQGTGPMPLLISMRGVLPFSGNETFGWLNVTLDGTLVSSRKVSLRDELNESISLDIKVSRDQRIVRISLDDDRYGTERVEILAFPDHEEEDGSVNWSDVWYYFQLSMMLVVGGVVIGVVAHTIYVRMKE